MKRSILILGTFIVIFSQLVNSQQIIDTLNGNSVSALIRDEGNIFRNQLTHRPGYEFPKGSGNHLIYSNSFWFGGTNQNGDLKLAGELFGIEREFYRGPISSSNDYIDTAYIYKYESAMWTIKKSEIIYHIDNHDQPGYVAPNSIVHWPGNGNSNIGVSEQLAPYVDLNNNGIYEPNLGDYPCIKGDMATYVIMNDDRPHLNTGADKIGIEIHMMFYQFQTNNFIDSTTFYDIKVINKGQHSFDNFKATTFIDSDIGFSEDDYIGSAPSKNLIYGYNGDNFDTGQGGATGYGENPPAVGLMSLNKDFEYMGQFFRGDLGIPTTSTPSTPADYWNYMNGKWKDGSDWTYGGNGYGGTIPYPHMFDGNPYLDTGWTEINTDGNGTKNSKSDRRFIATTIEETFNPGDTLTYNYAIIVNRQGNYLENVQGLINYADSAQNYFDNKTYSCLQQGTGITDNFDKEEPNLNLNFEITRLDGEGNMSRPVTLHKSTENDILYHGYMDKIKYERGKGPIEVRLTDTINHALGHFVLKFNEYGFDPDTANWSVYRYDTIGGTLLDSAHSTSAINLGNEHLFPQWSMAIRIEQINYNCPSPYNNNCIERKRLAQTLETSLTFENNEWLTGVKNTNANTPLNWIMSGGYAPPSGAALNDSIYDAICYSANFYDPFNKYAKLVDGIVSPSILARRNECKFAPLVISETVGNHLIMNSYNHTYLPIIYQPNIDIVFTDDTSKWTRSPVIELNSFDQGSVNGGKSGFLRQGLSVNKQGNPDGSGLGMGWFPGYAIDVETGRRLNIAFGENSTLTNDNGADMLWNPTERIFDNNGNFVLGGQHVIYVFGREENGMPIYDEGEFIRQELAAKTQEGYKNVYGNLSWVMQPLLKSGEQLNSSKARLRIRMNKEFKTNVLSDQNEGRPMFSWDAVPYDEIWLSTTNELKTPKLMLYPNPTENKVNIKWENHEVNKIKIISYQGQILQSIAVEGNEGKQTIDVSALSAGVYFVKVGSITKKLIVR